MVSTSEKLELKVVGTRPIRPDGVDKVTGRANFGADLKMAGMLHGKIKRSPHAHARIIRIDAEKALALPGVHVVVTAADFPEISSEEAFVGEGPMNFRDLSRNVMARDKVLYEGHAVAAVAATTPMIAAEALDLIEVEYEVLPFVIDVEDAMMPNAPLLHEDLYTQGVDPRPDQPSNIAKRLGFKKGDSAEGFRLADIIIERRYTTQPVHQAYIEPHACVVSVAADGQVQIWASSQGQFMIRAYCAKLLGLDIASIRVTPAERSRASSPTDARSIWRGSARRPRHSPRRWDRRGQRAGGLLPAIPAASRCRIAPGRRCVRRDRHPQRRQGRGDWRLCPVSEGAEAPRPAVSGIGAGLGHLEGR
jgi:CO/xanthine dehydrogenase Mo-binding subunit